MKKHLFPLPLVLMVLGSTEASYTQAFLEAGLTHQAGSAGGSGPSVNISSNLNVFDPGFTKGLRQFFLDNGANGTIPPSSVKATGISLNTGFHHFFPLTTSCAMSLGLTAGFTFLKASFTPKTTTLYGSFIDTGIASIGFTPPIGQNVFTGPRPVRGTFRTFNPSDSSLFSFKERGYVEIAPIIGLKWKRLHFIVKTGYAFHLISITPSQQTNDIGGPGNAGVRTNIKLSSKGANCFVIGGGIYAPVTAQADLGLTGAWHVGSIKSKGTIFVDDSPADNPADRGGAKSFKFSSRFQTMELSVVLRYNFYKSPSSK